MIKLTKKQRELLEKHIDEDNWSFRSDQERAVAFIRRKYVYIQVMYVQWCYMSNYNFLLQIDGKLRGGFQCWLFKQSVKRTVGKRLQTLYKESKIKRSQEKFYAMIKSDFLM